MSGVKRKQPISTRPADMRGACVLLLLLAALLLWAPSMTSAADSTDALYKKPIQLVYSAYDRRIYVVCENTDEVLVVDPRTEKVVYSVPVGAMPFGAALSPSGDRLYVSNRWDSTVTVVDTATLEVIKTVPTGDDPHQLVTDQSGKHLYVANLATNNVSVIETDGFTEARRLEAGKSPFGLALSPDGETVYVSNQLSSPVPFRTPSILELTVIDTAFRRVTGRRDLFSTVVGQGIAVAPENDLVVMALELPKNLIPETQIYQGWMVTHGLAFAETGPRGRVAFLLLDEPNRYFADPYDLKFSGDGRFLYASSSGVDTVSVVDMERVRALLEMQDGKIGISEKTAGRYARHLALSSDFVTARIPTQCNPKGMACSPDGRRLYVANRLSDSLTVIDTRTQKVTATIDLGGPTTVTQLRKGERLFNAAVISFQNQLSCSTCHPEYHLDGLIYDIAIDGGMGLNLVDNLSLQGIAETAPYKWSGKNPDLKRQEGPRAAQLFFRSHGFDLADQECVVKFIESIPVPPNRYLVEGGELNEFQKRGEALFHRAYTNDGRYIPRSNRCVTCHPPPWFTDRHKHDVGSQAYFDTKSDFDTPQLTNIYGKTPYMHDGRCYSLEEIWTVHNTYDLHGATNDMKKEQLNDLIEYIKALPIATAVDSVRSPVPSPEPAPERDPIIEYVGDDVCRSCHPVAFSKWLSSRHARAFVALQSGKARTIADAHEVAVEDPQESDVCLQCHATAWDVPSESRAPSFHPEEGVQCEACHSPGGQFAVEQIMMDRDAALAAGLMLSTEKQCLRCHKHKPSHALLGRDPFSFEEAWKKIEHTKE